jgi:hypothetical protein
MRRIHPPRPQLGGEGRQRAVVAEGGRARHGPHGGVVVLREGGACGRGGAGRSWA